MAIKHYDTQEELDDDFEKEMEVMQEEKRLKDLICEAEERVAAAHEELYDAEEELKSLQDQLEALDV